MLNGKATIILLIGGLMINEYFPETKYLGTNLKVELDLPYYATKNDFKNAAGFDTSDFA